MSKVNDLIQELIDWNYGTVYKGYDNEELTETLEEDTRAYIAKIFEELKSEMEKLKLQFDDPELAEHNREATTLFNNAISECQRVIDEALNE